MRARSGYNAGMNQKNQPDSFQFPLVPRRSPPTGEQVVSFVRRCNRQIGETGQTLSQLYWMLSKSLLFLQDLPRYGKHGRWEKWLGKWGISQSRWMRAKRIATTYVSTAQLKRVSVERALGVAQSKTAEYWAANGSATSDNQHDFYCTPTPVIKAFLEREEFSGLVWEPAAGDGASVSALREAGYEVLEGDIRTGTDFLHSRRRTPNIITNPPWTASRGELFVRHALKLATDKVAMLLPTWMLEGVERYELFTEHPVKAVYILSRRPKYQQGTMPFGSCWVVWQQGYRGKASVEWVLAD